MSGVPLDLALLRTLLIVIVVGVARTTAMLLITPFLGRGVLTGLARNGVILSVSLPVVLLLYTTLPPGADLGNVWLVSGLVIKETFVGLLLGLPVAAISWGLESAGALIDTQRGSTLAGLLDPATGNESSPTGLMLAQIYTVWLFVTGGFLTVLDLLYKSHLIWPAWSFLPVPGSGLPGQMLGLLDDVMLLTVLMAGPAVVSMFLSEAGLALVSRFAPQLQVFFLAMPVKSAVGLLMLALSLGVILEEATRRLGDADGLLALVKGWFG